MRLKTRMINENLTGPLLSRPISAPDPGRRIRLTVSVSAYGTALGAAAILISIIARTGIYDDAEHLTFVPSVLSALTGALAVALFTPLAIYHARDRANESSGLLIWLALGLGFGLTSSFVTGGLLPLSAVALSFAEGVVGLGELPSLVFEAALRGIRSFYIEGALALLTWLLAGALFGIGGWAMDKLNASSNVAASRYGTWAIALALGSTAVAIAVFGPPETLRKLG